jgi:hypothetical protein
MKFEIILEPEKNGGYSILCPTLEECLLVLNEKPAPNLRLSTF